MENNSKMISCVSVTTLVTLVFVTLKLCHVIDWSWWFVFLPSLVSIGVNVLILILRWVLMKNGIDPDDKL